jgi:hypothetical protein
MCWLADEEGQILPRMVRRGKHHSIQVRRAMIIMASSSGTRPQRSRIWSPPTLTRSGI